MFAEVEMVRHLVLKTWYIFDGVVAMTKVPKILKGIQYQIWHDFLGNAPHCTGVDRTLF
jgi:hypothetical protein